MNFNKSTIAEVDNNKAIDLTIRTKENPEPGEYVAPVDEYGILERKSHAHFVGSLTVAGGKLKIGSVNYFKPTETVISKSKIHGYGAFATKNYKVGDVIEEFFCILLDTTTDSSVDFMLNRYALLWECDCPICNKNGKTLVIPTGNVLVYNHSDTPNVFISIEKQIRKGKVIALRDIDEGEELVRYYGKEHEKLLEKEPYITTRLDVLEGLPVRMANAEIEDVLNVKKQVDLENSEIIGSDKNALNATMFRSMIVPEKLL